MARRRAKGSRRIPFFRALFPYLGGKRRLCPLIFREVDRLLPRRHWAGRTFLDGFLGGGSASAYAKAMGFRVIATDIATRSITVGRALVENSRVKLTREDVLRLLEPTDDPPGRIERELVPAVFTANLARFLDRALAIAAATADQAKAALFRMLAIRLALLEHPMSQVRKGTIHRVATGEYEAITDSCVHHYVEGLRLTRPDRVWQLAQQLNAGVFQGEGRVIQASIFDVLPEVRADVAYFDPPYPGVMSYEKEYRVIDQILEGAPRSTSPFTARDGAALIDGLFERAGHIPIWILSLGNQVVTIGELEEKMRRLGRETRAIEVRYQHLPAVATPEKKEANREFLVVGWDPAAELFRSVGRIPVTEQVAQRDLPDIVAGDVETKRHRGGPVNPSAQSIPSDRLEQRQARLPEHGIADGRLRASEAQLGLDPSDTLADEVALDANRVPLVHDTTVARPRRRRQQEI